MKGAPGPGKTPPKWEPSEEEIAAECLKIQAGWSEAERAKRRVFQPPLMTVEFVSINTLGG